MSQSESFIEEVTEEVRRDRLFALMRRYGWIAITVVVVLVLGAAYSEFRRAQAESRAQALGDAAIAALETNDAGARLAALDEISGGAPGAQAVMQLLASAEALSAEDPQGAIARLNAIASNGEVAQVYRDLAGFKALLLKAAQPQTDPAELRQGLSALAMPGHMLRVLAEEQLALLDLRAGDTASAAERLKALVRDAEATNGLRTRAAQLIVALEADDEGAGAPAASQ